MLLSPAFVLRTRCKHFVRHRDCLVATCDHYRGTTRTILSYPCVDTDTSCQERTSSCGQRYQEVLREPRKYCSVRSVASPTPTVVENAQVHRFCPPSQSSGDGLCATLTMIRCNGHHKNVRPMQGLRVPMLWDGIRLAYKSWSRDVDRLTPAFRFLFSIVQPLIEQSTSNSLGESNDRDSMRRVIQIYLLSKLL